MTTGTPLVRRCAVYTRTAALGGTAQPITQAVQREACLSYIQRQVGWTVVGQRYDDRGKSGANLHRPALQRLLADVDAGRLDVVVVYQLDRLTRWFADFVALMDRFGRAGVSWVSVNEDIATTEAIGQRLLGVVMSFAELERVVHGAVPAGALPGPGHTR